MKNISGIYQIQSKFKPERVYIGSAVNIQKRWWVHLCELRANKHKNKKLQNHYNKYNETDLQFSVLLGCDKEDLLKTEQYFIDSYKPYFNICIIAGSSFGLKRSEDCKKKLSQSHKGKYTGEKHPMFGKKHTKESLIKMSETKKGQTAWNKGLSQSKEQRMKNSIAKRGNTNMLGKHHSEEAKDKIRRANIGRKASESTKRKMSLVHKGKSIPEESKKKMWEEKRGMYPGRKMSDEYKQKIKDSWAIRKAKKADKLIMQISNN